MGIVCFSSIFLIIHLLACHVNSYYLNLNQCNSYKNATRIWRMSCSDLYRVRISARAEQKWCKHIFFHYRCFLCTHITQSYRHEHGSLLMDNVWCSNVNRVCNVNTVVGQCLVLPQQIQQFIKTIIDNKSYFYKRRDSQHLWQVSVITNNEAIYQCHPASLSLNPTRQK